MIQCSHMNPSVKTLFCDLGNVILFFSHDKMVEQISQATQLDNSAVRHFLFERSYGPLYEKGEIDSLALYRKVLTMCSAPLTYADFYRAVADIFTLNLEIIPILETLKKQNIKLILLSNTCPAHFEFAEKNFPILNIFDDFVLSYRVKALKPEKKIYTHALSLARCLPEECLYIDDVPVFTSAAHDLGIPSITFTTAEALTKDLQQRHLIGI
jgi:HAD superfamily hydrolase (TIGR01509 family)